MQLSELNGFLDLFARNELENLVNSTSPREWLSGYVERHYNNSAEGEPAFISVSMSIESMILHDSAVIPPFLMGLSRRIQAAVFSFIASVMPPMPMLGRSLL
jgi:hypothetical protein